MAIVPSSVPRCVYDLGHLCLKTWISQFVHHTLKVAAQIKLVFRVPVEPVVIEYYVMLSGGSSPPKLDTFPINLTIKL